MSRTSKRKLEKTSPGAAASGGRRARAWSVVFGSLLVGAICCLAFLNYHLSASHASSVATSGNPDLWERCLELCREYGLIPTGRLDADARAYLEAAKHEPPSEAPSETPADASFEPAETQPHPLLGKLAPEFALPDDQGTVYRLSELRKEGPVVVVFYYGYYCSHCVAQLFGIHDDFERFRELGAQVVAISADTPEETAEKLAEYGRFAFPALSDAENAIAELYGTYRPERDGEEEQLQHGTFLIDRDGKIVWANRGPEPYVDNKTLLHILAQMRGRAATPRGRATARADASVNFDSR